MTKIRQYIDAVESGNEDIISKSFSQLMTNKVQGEIDIQTIAVAHDVFNAKAEPQNDTVS